MTWIDTLRLDGGWILTFVFAFLWYLSTFQRGKAAGAQAGQGLRVPLIVSPQSLEKPHRGGMTYTTRRALKHGGRLSARLPRDDGGRGGVETSVTREVETKEVRASPTKRTSEVKYMKTEDSWDGKYGKQQNDEKNEKHERHEKNEKNERQEKNEKNERSVRKVNKKIGVDEFGGRRASVPSFLPSDAIPTLNIPQNDIPFPESIKDLPIPPPTYQATNRVPFAESEDLLVKYLRRVVDHKADEFDQLTTIEGMMNKEMRPLRDDVLTQLRRKEEFEKEVRKLRHSIECLRQERRQVEFDRVALSQDAKHYEDNILFLSQEIECSRKDIEMIEHTNQTLRVQRENAERHLDRLGEAKRSVVHGMVDEAEKLKNAKSTLEAAKAELEKLRRKKDGALSEQAVLHERFRIADQDRSRQLAAVEAERLEFEKMRTLRMQTISAKNDVTDEVQSYLRSVVDTSSKRMAGYRSTSRASLQKTDTREAPSEWKEFTRRWDTDRHTTEPKRGTRQSGGRQDPPAPTPHFGRLRHTSEA